jgi:hypothetical protein
MTDTTPQAVVETPAPDAIAPDETKQVEQVNAESSPAVNDADETSDPKPKGVQKRIDELTRNWREAERREAALLEMLQRANPAKAEPVEAPKPLARPKLENFNYDEAAYEEALDAYYDAKSDERVEAKLKARDEQAAAKARVESWKSRETEFKAKTSDYDTVARDSSLPISAAMADVIRESERGPELLYHLGKNRDLAEQIYGLSKEMAAYKLGRIEAKLDVPPPAPAAIPKPAVSKAPPPPPKIDATDATPTFRTTDASGDALSDAEWVKAESARLARKVKRNA